MAKANHLYLRGSHYWFRTSITLQPRSRIDVRLPLLTDSACVARRLCLILEGARAQISGKEHEVFGLRLNNKVAGSNPQVTVDDLKPLVRRFFTDVRDKAFQDRRDISDRDWNGTAHRLAVGNFDYLNLLAETRTTRTSVNWPRVEDWIETELELGRLDRVRAEAVMAALRRHVGEGDTFPFSTDIRDWYASRTGRTFEAEDKARLDDLFLEAAREAWFQLEADRQQTNQNYWPDELIETFPDYQRPFEAAALIKELGLQRAFARPGWRAEMEAREARESRVGAGQGPNPAPDAETAREWAQRAERPQSSADPADARVRVQHERDEGQFSSDVTFGRALEEFILNLHQANDGKHGAENQYRAMAKLLFHVVGGPDEKVSILRQQHLGEFVSTLRRLPTMWGKSAVEQAGGIAVSLQLAASLPADQVGVSAITEGRHLSSLSRFLEFCGGRGYADVQRLNVSQLRKERSKQRSREKKQRTRVNWTTEECARLLEAPPYTGSRGPTRMMRYRPGKYLYMDSAYWMPLMLLLMGFRSAEAGGVLISHINLAEAIPTIKIAATSDRGVKTDSSTRELPIHPELLRLGFAEFVAAVSARGCRHLFPDLVPTARTDTFAKKYYDSFVLHRKWAFPNGTADLRIVGKSRQDKDVHSFRGLVITEILHARHPLTVVSEIVGHDAESQKEIREAIENGKINKTTLRYCDQPTLKLMLDALEETSHITKHLQPIPVVLNPCVYRAKDN
jgi:integrase